MSILNLKKSKINDLSEINVKFFHNGVKTVLSIDYFKIKRYSKKFLKIGTENYNELIQDIFPKQNWTGALLK